MKAIVTGMSGTVGAVLAQALGQAGHEVTGWDREVVPPDEATAVTQFIQREQPDWLFHLAMGSPDWAAQMATVCTEVGCRFLYTSSVSVYSGTQTGPFTVQNQPMPDDDYGRYKLTCEQRIQHTCPEAHIVRLGWQIGHAPGGNQMVDYLHRTFQEKGDIEASTNWFQACSFLEDTAVALIHTIRQLPGGLYHLDANPGLSFYEIVSHLNQLHGRSWQIKPTDTPQLNNRLLDDHLPVTPITNHFTV